MAEVIAVYLIKAGCADDPVCSSPFQANILMFVIGSVQAARMTPLCQTRKKCPLQYVTEALGDLSRYEIVTAALGVTGKYIFLKLTIFVQS